MIEDIGQCVLEHASGEPLEQMLLRRHVPLWALVSLRSGFAVVTSVLPPLLSHEALDVHTRDSEVLTYGWDSDRLGIS